MLAVDLASQPSPLMLAGWTPRCLQHEVPKGMPIAHALKFLLKKKIRKSPEIAANRNFRDGELEITCSERVAKSAGSF